MPIGQHSGSITEGDDYENAYGSITKIVQSGSVLEPYLKDANGERYNEDHNVLTRLYHPNIDMSDEEFRAAMFLLYLTKPKFYIRVHYSKNAKRANGTIDANKITGFTFLERVTPIRIAGELKYQTALGTFDEKEVMSFGGLNPNGLLSGYSPMQAVRRWNRIEDYMADYQAAHFRNGAVPAGMFIITAPSEAAFKDIKKKMQSHARGAKNNNNILYSYKPVSSSGIQQQAQIEWIPFNTSNKDLALKDLHEIVQNKQDDAFGVSGVIRGDVSETTFASARVVEKLFVKYTLKPTARAIYRRLSHELARVTGGYGFSVGFDLEIPVLEEELTQQAEAKGKDADTIIKLHKHFTVDSIVDAFEYPERYKMLVPVDSSASEDKNDEETSTDVVAAGDQGDQRIRQDETIEVSAKSLASRDIDGLHDDDRDDFGCIMLDVEKVEVLSVVKDGETDLIEATSEGDHQMGAVAEHEPHITLLYGLLENGNDQKDKVDSLLEGISIETVEIESVDYFDSPDNYAVVAKIKQTPELIEAHGRLLMLDNRQTFSEYTPHMTLAYINKDADVNKWVSALDAKYKGKIVKAIGINYGDEAEKETASKTRADESRKTSSKVMGAVITDEDTERIGSIIHEFTRDDFENMALAYLNSNMLPAYDPDKNKALYNILTNEYTSLLFREGSAVFEALRSDLDPSLFTDDASDSYELSEYIKRYYQDYFTKVAAKYNDKSRKIITNLIQRAVVDDWTQDKLEQKLQDAGLEKYRATRLAKSELNRAKNHAQADGHRKVAEGMMDHYYVKVWSADGIDPCAACKALDKTEAPLDGAFMQHDHEIVDEDGEVFENTYVDMVTADAHPNCECNQKYELREY